MHITDNSLEFGDDDDLDSFVTELEGRLEVMEDDGEGLSPDAEDIQTALDEIGEVARGASLSLSRLAVSASVWRQIQITAENIADCQSE